jgi:NAD-dependent SIR2 family protein deacetylase
MKKCGSIFVLTGAGISAESGIPVFQGTNWHGYSHYELANIEAWEKDPRLVWQYYSDRRASARDARPNAAHIALARWNQESGDGGCFLCTQNVDSLHEAAGSQHVVHIHGKVFESRCAGDCGRAHSMTLNVTERAIYRAALAEHWCALMSAGLESSLIIWTTFILRCKNAMCLSPSALQDQCSRWRAL